MGISQQIGASSLIKPGVIDSAATRPASPYEGQVIFQKDTDQILVWSGAAWVCTSSLAGLQIDSSGQVTTPLQPAFYATGASGSYTSGTLPYSTATTNIGNHYNTTTRTFTAPIAGMYLFTTQHWADPNAAGAIYLTVAGRNAIVGRESAQAGYEGYCGSQVAYMTVGQTATTSVYLGSVHLNSSLSYFSGVFLG